MKAGLAAVLVGDIAGVMGEPIEVPASAKAGTDVIVRIEGIDITPYDGHKGPPENCEERFFELIHHVLTLRFESPGVRTLSIHVLLDGEIMHIPRDVDIQP